jgi:hypothetical protein
MSVVRVGCTGGPPASFTSPLARFSGASSLDPDRLRARKDS